MKKALAILISIFLLFSFIACSSETPEPPAVEEPPATEFDKADETLTSLDDLFAASLPEEQEDGSLVSTVENTVIDGKEIESASKTVSADGTEITTTAKYTENGVVYEVTNKETDKVSYEEGATEEEKTVADAKLDSAKMIPSNAFEATETKDGIEYVYTKSELLGRVARAAGDNLPLDEAIEKVVITFCYGKDEVSYTYKVTYKVDEVEKTVTQTVTKTTTIYQDGNLIDVSEDLKNEFSFDSIQNGDKKMQLFMATAALFGAEYNIDGVGFVPEIGASITIGQKGNTLLDAAIIKFNPESYTLEVAIKTVAESLGLPITSGSTLYVSDYEEEGGEYGDTYYHSNGNINIKDNKGDYIVINIDSYDDWNDDSNNKEVITIEKLPAPLTATVPGEEEPTVKDVIKEGDVFSVSHEYVEGVWKSNVTLTRDGEETSFDSSSLITLDVVQSLFSLISGGVDDSGQFIPAEDPLQISFGVDLGVSGGHFDLVEYPDSTTEDSHGPIYTPFIDKASFDIGIDVSFNFSMDIINDIMELIDQITSDANPEPIPNPDMPESFAQGDGTEESVNPITVIFQIIEKAGMRGEAVISMDFTGAKENNFGADKVSYSVRIPSFAINIVCVGGSFAGEYSVSFDDISSLIPSYDVPSTGGEVTVPAV